MRALIVIALMMLALRPAAAQEARPITLTAQEYQAIVNELIARDPVLALLVKRQQEAQAEARSTPPRKD